MLHDKEYPATHSMDTAWYIADEDGNVGWTDFYADADALARGNGYYYDIHGNKVTGKKIVSAVTGFVPRRRRHWKRRM